MYRAVAALRMYQIEICKSIMMVFCSWYLTITIQCILARIRLATSSTIPDQYCICSASNLQCQLRLRVWLWWFLAVIKQYVYSTWHFVWGCRTYPEHCAYAAGMFATINMRPNREQSQCCHAVAPSRRSLHATVYLGTHCHARQGTKNTLVDIIYR